MEKTGETRPASFIPLAREITVSSVDYMDELTVKYSGGVGGTSMNIITGEMKAYLSFLRNPSDM